MQAVAGSDTIRCLCGCLRHACDAASGLQDVYSSKRLVSCSPRPPPTRPTRPSHPDIKLCISYAYLSALDAFSSVLPRLPRTQNQSLHRSLEPVDMLTRSQGSPGSQKRPLRRLCLKTWGFHLGFRVFGVEASDQCTSAIDKLPQALQPESRLSVSSHRLNNIVKVP